VARSSRISRIVHAAQLDRAVLWGLGGRIWSASAGPITALIIAYTFSPEVQGYHYTFLSLVALQIFLELGLSGVITTFASHEWVNLEISSEGRITGDPAAISRLASITRLGIAWFGFCAVALTIGLVIAGVYFFSSSQPAAQLNWRGPWVLLSILSGAHLVILPIWALLLGCNRVADINRYRFSEGAIRSCTMWTAILLGAGLWTASISSLAALVWACAFLIIRYRSFLVSLLKAPMREKVGWKAEILPLQWRIALSWISGYFMFFLFTPVLFHFQGPIVAGQMGMTWAVIAGVSGLAGTWIQVKVPQFGMLVAKKDYAELDRIVLRVGFIAFLIACAGGLVVLGIIAALAYFHHPLSSRLLPLGPVGIFVAAEVLHQISIAQSSYLRAFKKEPFLMLGISNGLMVGVFTIIFAKYFGATGVAMAYLAGVILALTWGSRIFIRCRRDWIGST
jgi:hypothetical protein